MGGCHVDHIFIDINILADSELYRVVNDVALHLSDVVLGAVHN